MNIKHSEALKHVRLIAKFNGLVFVKQRATINNNQSYQFNNRTTGLCIASNFTLWSAYENCLSGYIDILKQ
tara:strand:+ start:364 stop:576 length:213 start_codon:yes stop_codon:yes gene_type:complete